MQKQTRLAVMRTLYRNSNRMTLEDFQAAMLRDGYNVGLPELRELQMAQDVALVDGMWVALKYNELFTAEISPAKQKGIDRAEAMREVERLTGRPRK